MSSKETLVEHQLVTKRSDAVALEFARATEGRRTVLSDANSDRSWTRYVIRYPLPKKLKATHKTMAGTVALGLAVPEQPDTTRFYTGLPLDEPCDLPFSVNAPFDPNVDRTQVRDHNALNEWLIARLGDLATAVCLHRFAEKPSSGWTAVPLRSERAGRPTSWLRQQTDVMLARTRGSVGRRRGLTHADGTELSLENFVVEPEELDGLLGETDVERLYDETKYNWLPSRYAVPKRWRGKGKRWREVLTDLDDPAVLSVNSALTILDWDDDEIAARGTSWLVRVVAGGLAAHADDVLWQKRCVVLERARRLAPADLAARGTLLAYSLAEDSLASALEVGELIEASFRTNTASARVVREWLIQRELLRERPGDAHALRALARAERDTPLSLVGHDDLLLRLRDALERTPANDRETIALGLGRNIALAGFEFEQGKRKHVGVTPAGAYLPSAIDKNEGWPAAAAQTPGIRWIDRRYADRLKRSREARGQGALAFLRLLGAATAPRLVSAPPPAADPHAWIDVRGLSAQHREELAAFPSAGGLAHDLVSPDLDRVVSDLLRERLVADRRRRSRALFLCLDRAWNDRRDPYAPHATATAVRHYYSWHTLGDVSATWVANLASQPWLSSQERKFTPKPPRELAVLTEASYEVEGQNPGRYAYEIDAEHADSPVVEALGIEGRPSATTIIERLEELRAAEERGESIHQAWTDRCYRALGAYCEGGRYADRSSVTKRELQKRFGTAKRGLIRWDGQWLPPKEVRCGPYIGDAVPWVGEHQPLWDTLGIAEPGVDDCRKALSHLAFSQDSDRSTEVRAYRRVLALLAADRRTIKKVRTFPLRTYRGWVEIGKTDVYAVPDTTLAAALGEHWPVWRIPLPFGEVEPLANILGVVVLGEDATRPGVPTVALAGSDLQDEFPAAVGHLQDYLVLHHLSLCEKISKDSWMRLGAARVVLGSDWSVRVTAPRRRALQLRVAAHLFRTPFLFCAIDENEAARCDAGGQAVAGYLLGSNASAQEQSVVSLAWEVAFRRRRDERDALELAPPETDEPQDMPLPPLQRRGSSAKSRKKLNSRRGTPTPRPEPRRLVSLDELNLTNIRVTVLDSKRRSRIRATHESPLKDPKPGLANGGGSGPSDSIAVHRGYSDREREDLALNIIREILRDTHGLDLEDLRDQRNTGADAVDRQQDVWVELKAHGRDVSDTVRLEPSEAQRAREKRGKYWLVVAWNLERPRTPEYVIIPDPLYRLDAYLGRGMTLTGVRELSGASLE
jgi:hypothetical protein